MKNLEKLTRYILLKYPNLVELSKPRLVKLIYLIDWKYAIENGVQYTDIDWIYNHYGPYVNDVINLMKEKREIFNVNSYRNSYGTITDKFSLKNDAEIELQDDVKSIADKFINYTHSMPWTEFINTVYSSYPMKESIKYSHLDLVKFAQVFNSLTRRNTEVVK